MLTGKFVMGDRGPICRRPSDSGAWVVPARGEKTPEFGVEYVLEISGTANSGNLRFARVVETVAAREAALAEEIRQALVDPSKLEGGYLGSSRYLLVTLGGRSFRLDEGDRRPHKSPTLIWGEYVFPLTKAARAALLHAEDVGMEKARADHVAREAAQERHAAAITAVAKKRAEDEQKLVAAFLADHPEAVGWFGKPVEEVNFSNDIAGEAVKRGLAKKVGEVRNVGGLSYRHQFFEQNYVLLVGGREVALTQKWDDDEYDD